MQYVRVVHPLQISEIDGKPSDLAFKKSSDGSGISCFALECALAQSGSICNHIARFYGEPVSGDPVIFWIVPDSPVLARGQWIQSVSTTGDDCHHSLIDLSRSAAAKLVREQPLDAFSVCAEKGIRALQLSDLIESRQRYAKRRAADDGANSEP